ncbi:hypothetical protein SNOG_09501 [Parastagonospora nodorum SN15]|uniref:Uncharacterized protein n=1 Tax=Phaeosphaeria nodorum (strain SN15 / ATCC MYA-4574 / FGSC 10173) TaxID=321614 RepID=Q0UFG3_PHANO|nr:hypothetical protein SNOG_09501 [Parastagonospora nodorum SN15]EAT82766.1 hypothetical protein SNOG_09501 [Parastagonospora nodorum SN15]
MSLSTSGTNPHSFDITLLGNLAYGQSLHSRNITHTISATFKQLLEDHKKSSLTTLHQHNPIHHVSHPHNLRPPHLHGPLPVISFHRYTHR